MFQRTDDLRITQVRPLIPPAILLEEIPISEKASNVVSNTRAAISDVLGGRHHRLGDAGGGAGGGPSPVPDSAQALDYAGRLALLAERYASELIVVMRTYFEKPRT